MDESISSASSDASYQTLNPCIPDKLQIDQWRKEWKSLSEGIRQLAGSDTVLQRAIDDEKIAKAKHRAAKRKAAQATQRVIDAADALDSAHNSALGLVTGRASRRSTALQRAEKEAEIAHRHLTDACRVHSAAANEAQARRADDAALRKARLSQRAILAKAASLGAFEDPEELCATTEAASIAADAQRNMYELELSVYSNLKAARAQLTKARFFVVEPRAHAVLDIDQAIEDGAEIDESAVKQQLPGKRFAMAVEAHDEARKAIRASMEKSPNLPVAQEKLIIDSLLHAFTSLSREKGSIDGKHFTHLDRCLKEMLGTIESSIEEQEKKLKEVGGQLKKLVDKEDALSETLAKKRHDLLFTDP